MSILWGRTLTGAAAGFTLAYAAVRAAQAVRDLRTPIPARAARDPKRYAALRRSLLLAGTARGLATQAAAGFLLADRLERAARPLPGPLRAPAFAAALLAIDAAAELGVAYVEGHVTERIWGTSEQRAGDWLADQAKGLALSCVAGALLVALAQAGVRRAPRHWPWLAVAAAPPLLAFATVIVPAFVLPLFNHYEPVTGELEARIRALAARYGVGNAHILRFDMSRRTKKANAFVTGVLGTERIALGDTLLDAFEQDETLFVVAHELGHYVRRDPWTGIALGTAAVGVTLFAADALLRASTGRRLDSAAQGARLAFFASVVQQALAPLMHAGSRALERRADRFAVQATGDPQSGVRAFRRLGEQNLAEFDPPRWAELLLASHPSLASRIRALEAAG